MMPEKNSDGRAVKNLRLVFFLNLSFTVFEVIGGFYVNSIAIISDALHDAGDSLSLGISWYLQNKSTQSPDKSFTFGYRRFSLIGALINSVVLIAGSVFIIYEAVGRIIEPEASDALGMLFFALVGVAVNGYAAWKLSSGKTLNERVISWHLMEDVLGWSAVLVVAIVLQFHDNYYLDPALSLMITIFILWKVIGRLKETLFIFLQGQPKDIDRDLLEKQILEIEHVQSVHHTHIWSLDGERHVFTSHVRLDRISDFSQLLAVKKHLGDVMRKYPFEHFTIETELHSEQCALDPDEKNN